MQKRDHTFAGQGRPTKDKQSELMILKQEKMRLKEKIEILKNASAFFAQGRLSSRSISCASSHDEAGIDC